MRRSPFGPQWERVGTTWCRSHEGRHVEISRELNPLSSLIEWRVLAWDGHDRHDPILDTFTEQSLGDAIAVAREVV